MQAALLHSYGAAPEPGERPEPQDAATVVDVHAAPIVPLDLLCASGTSYFGQQPLPYVPGVQGVGVIVRSPVLAVGTRVWFATTAGMQPGDGSMAELCVVASDDLVPIDGNVSDAHAAAIGTSGIAAWMALTWRGQLHPGERVVILGASGVVGQVAVAVARHLGAERVVAVVRSEAAAGLALTGGAHQAVLTGGSREDLTARLVDACGGPADVVLDPVFGEPAAAAVEALAPFGRLVNLGGAAGDRTEVSSATLRGKSLAVLGYTNNAISTAQRAEALTAVLALAGEGLLAVQHQVRPLRECTHAWRDAQSSGSRVVLDPRR